MKIVLLGNADSIWVKEYIDNVLVHGEEIVIVSRENRQFSDWYKERNIVVKTCGTGIRSQIPIIFNWFLLNRELRKEIGKYDVLHVQYIDVFLLLRCMGIISLAKEVIYTYWGSDLLRTSKWEHNVVYPFLKKASRIVLMTEAMQSKFDEVYSNKLSGKTMVLDFGNPGYDSIRKYATKMTKQECKKYWGIETDKIVVPIGYNGKAEQQHLQIIEQLNKLPKEILRRYKFVFHLGYGNNDKEYYEKIICTVERCGLDYVVIERFLDKDEIAILRLCADVFLYGQTTDALSGSVLEYLYAGCALIKPEWLDYSVLKELQIPYIEYSAFEQIPDIFKELSVQDAMDVEGTRRKLWNMNSWQALAPKWHALYNSEEK